MKRIGFRTSFGTAALAAVWLASCAPTPNNTTLARLGQQAPAFELMTVDDTPISLKSLQGKVVLVNFFATWCPPCLEEMPHLEKEVWRQFQGDKFMLLSVGREHTNEELQPFRKEQQLTFPMAGDPSGKVFSRYAEEFIPRNFLVGADGRIAYESAGFSSKDFADLIEAIRTELAKTN
jgi:peroxiredoxin